MATSKTLKEIPLSDLQAAFSKALTDLAGKEYEVTLHGLQFDSSPTRSIFGELATFSGQVQSKKDYSAPPASVERTERLRGGEFFHPLSLVAPRCRFGTMAVACRCLVRGTGVPLFQHSAPVPYRVQRAPGDGGAAQSRKGSARPCRRKALNW